MSIQTNENPLHEIFGLIACGTTCLLLAIPGDLHSTDRVNVGESRITVSAPARKLPLTFAAGAFFYMAWMRTRDLMDYEAQCQFFWEQTQAQLQRQREYEEQLAAVEQEARLKAAKQVANIEAAEAVVEQVGPYIEVQQAVAQQQQAEAAKAEAEAAKEQIATLPESTTTPAIAPAAEMTSPTVIVQPVRFPEEDLAERLAETTIDPSKASSSFIACPKRTGKTNLLKAAVFKAYTLHNGKIDFSVFAGKDEETYCGLEGDPDRYVYSGDMHNAVAVFKRMMAFKPRLERKTDFPTVLVQDEYNNTLEAATMMDRLRRQNPQITALIASLTYEQVTKGGSKRVVGWITSHEANVTAVRMSLALQQSLNFIILARGNKLGAIHSALTARRPIIDDDLIREAMKQKFEAYRGDNSADYERVIALTNILGDWRLVQLPKYPDTQPAVHLTVDPPDFEEEPQPQLPIALQVAKPAESTIPAEERPVDPASGEPPLTENASLLLEYLRKKGKITTTTINRNWGCNTLRPRNLICKLSVSLMRLKPLLHLSKSITISTGKRSRTF